MPQASPETPDLFGAAPTVGPPLKLTIAGLEDRLVGFVEEYLLGKSPETVGTYRRSLNEFERYFARQRGRFLFRTDDIEKYKAYLMEERELSQVSVSTYLTALRRLCQYLVDRGELGENPARAVKGNRRPGTHSRAVLREAEIEALFDAVDTSALIGKRDYAVMALMLYGGLAEIEIVRADAADLETTLMGTFLKVQGKGHTAKDQQVPLDETASGPLQAYLDARGPLKPESPLVVSHGHRSDGERMGTRSVRSRINGYLKAAGLKRPGVSPHSLTHTAALLWLNAGMEVEEVRRRMRHGTLDTTMIYFRKQGLLTRDPEADAPRA